MLLYACGRLTGSSCPSSGIESKLCSRTQEAKDTHTHSRSQPALLGTSMHAHRRRCHPVIQCQCFAPDCGGPQRQVVPTDHTAPELLSPWHTARCCCLCRHTAADRLPRRTAQGSCRTTLLVLPVRAPVHRPPADSSARRCADVVWGQAGRPTR